MNLLNCLAMTTIPPSNMSEINRLLEGYQNFRSQYFSDTQASKLMRTLACQGQRPKVLIVACSDSRIDPNAMFSCDLGQLFVVRNVANLVPPFDDHPRHHSTSAALEFAVQQLLVEHIIVLGHGQCGGIQAMLETADPTLTKKSRESFILNWMEIAEPARQKTFQHCNHRPFAEQARYCEEEALRISLHNLLSFPWIKAKVVAGQLGLHAWHWDLTSGGLRQLNNTDNQFVELSLTGVSSHDYTKNQA